MRLLTLIAIIAFALPASADEFGTLNPEELTLQHAIEKAARGHVDMMTCAAGYPLTKSGRHGQARLIFKLCAEQGFTAAMTWMSQMDDNGLGAVMDPAAAARWDEQAALAGDPVGLLNFGLDLLRGRGVAANSALGQHYIDQAADSGLPMAQQLRRAGYDTEVVTPDADDWKYGSQSF